MLTTGEFTDLTIIYVDEHNVVYGCLC